MKEDSTKTALGNIKIHKNVLISTAYIAVLETEGVYGFYVNTRDEIYKMFNKDFKPGVVISLDKNNEIIIILSVIVKYGYNISSVAAKIQENVRFAIDKIVEANIKDINVIIKGLERR
jgi:uncharacterized alkaline shock family protein YloU